MSEYGEEVVGRTVMVQFPVGDTGRHAFYRGEIDRVDNFVTGKENGIIVLHHVVFDDGEDNCYDLREQEELGRLEWAAVVNDSKPAAKKTAAKKTSAKKTGSQGAAARKRATPPTQSAAVTPEKKKKKVKEKKTDEVTRKESDGEDFLVDDLAEDLAVAVRDAAVASASSGASPENSSANESMPEAEWLDEFGVWLRTVPHGRRQKVASEANARTAVRQVRKLVAGEGITYKGWPNDTCFYEGRKIGLGSNFQRMHAEAKQFEKTYGKDKGNGWLLQHPIKKLELFQEYKRNGPVGAY